MLHYYVRKHNVLMLPLGLSNIFTDVQFIAINVIYNMYYVQLHIELTMQLHISSLMYSHTVALLPKILKPSYILYISIPQQWREIVWLIVDEKLFLGAPLNHLGYNPIAPSSPLSSYIFHQPDTVITQLSLVAM